MKIIKSIFKSKNAIEYERVRILIRKFRGDLVLKNITGAGYRVIINSYCLILN